MITELRESQKTEKTRNKMTALQEGAPVAEEREIKLGRTVQKEQDLSKGARNGDLQGLKILQRYRPHLPTGLLCN